MTTGLMVRRIPPALPAPTIQHVIELTSNGYRAMYKDLLIMVTDFVERDGKAWRHASVSRRDRKIPTYEDLKNLYELTMEGLVAYQLFVPPDQHFTLKTVEVLHLWACLEGPVTPDFRHYGAV